VPPDFLYTSDGNDDWMGIDSLRTWIEANRDKIGAI
jgi:hypothetical protein